MASRRLVQAIKARRAIKAIKARRDVIVDYSYSFWGYSVKRFAISI